MRAVSFLFICTFIVSASSLQPRTYQRIAGGAVATIQRYPYATALLTNAGSGSVYLQACGGTILTTSALLSAASCFETDGTAHPVQWWRARVGSSFGNSGGNVHLIRVITLHPDYNSAGDRDIAVLRVTVPLVFGDNVGPANIAGAAYPAFGTNEEISAIGWGLVSEPSGASVNLREVQFWVVNHQTCVTRYGAHGFTVTDNMVCAGWLDVGVRAQCQGDTGSPLIHKGAVVGVYSWTHGTCAEGRYPGVNTKVAPHTAWIVATANA